MPDSERTLGVAAARAYYDWFGRKQDSQGFYEDPALDDLVAHSDFDRARSVFEFGCGTGRLAARLLEEHLPSSATYVGCDVSPVMVDLAKRRLETYGERARVILSDGAVRFPLSERSIDRVVCTYVLDLLPEADIRQFFAEAHRVLIPGGRVCLASLTRGVNLASRVVSSLWMTVFRFGPSIVGGCRPIRIEEFVPRDAWRIVHWRIVTPWGLSSEVLILESLPGAGR